VTYVGRFAPSPSGALHLGSVVAAAASYLDARTHAGRWLLRIEDLDTGRSDAKVAQGIIDTLARLGMQPDDAPTYQSRQLDRYRRALSTLSARGLTYPCACTRAEIRAASTVPGVYPGTCRDGLPPGRKPRSTRVRLDQAEDSFFDRFAGPQLSRIGRDYGDPAVVRADGAYAYLLAGAIDDVLDEVTDVVRGDDLLPTTSTQRLLLAQLDLKPPRYAHIPVIRGDDGRKLSKQNHAQPVDADAPVAVMSRAFEAMGLSPYLSRAEARASQDALWDDAISAWPRFLADRAAVISR